MARTVVDHLAWRMGAQKWLAVMHQGMGWPGWGGIVLLAAAAYLAVLSPAQDESIDTARSSQAVSAKTALPAADPAYADMPVDFRALKGRRDIPSLVTLMERAATDSGLPWPGAEYRVAPATERSLAQLQVRFNLKAPYPKLRRMLVQLTDTVPGLIFQEFSLTRPTPQQVDVEAKLRIDVLLDEEEGEQSDAAATMPAAGWRKLP